MSNNMKVLLAVLAVCVLSAAGMYWYSSSDSFKVLKQAQERYAEGDIYTAHDLAEEAMRLDPTNRRAIALKAELYGEVVNDSSLKMAQAEYEQGSEAYDAHNYNEAATHFESALAHIDNISSAAKQYDAGQELEREIYRKSSEVNEKLNEQRYNNAMRMYRNGELMRAYEHLRLITENSPQADLLKNNIAYDLGLKRYNEIMNSASDLEETYYNDALYWLSQVSSLSSNYQTAQQMVSTLKEKDKRKTTK